MDNFSKTALGAATLRAVHQLVDDEPKILEDPIILRLHENTIVDRISANPGLFQTPRLNGLRSHIVLRSRFAEDCLAEAVQRGIAQYVILGAGLDTFSYRQPPWAKVLRIFEVDHPASQQFKQETLNAAGVPIPSNLEFVAIDFEKVSLSDGLASSNFDAKKPAFFSWLGVMAYLSEAAIDEVFHFVLTLPPKSEIVFTFAAPAVERETQSPYSTAARAAAYGEPWLSRFNLTALAGKLERMGFVTVTFLTPEEAKTRYFAERYDGLQPPGEIRIACAMV